MKAYEAQITAKLNGAKHYEAVAEAMVDSWAIDQIVAGAYHDALVVVGTGTDYIINGDEDLAMKDIARAIWQANGGHCEVTVDLLCLDALPWRRYDFPLDTYKDK